MVSFRSALNYSSQAVAPATSLKETKTSIIIDYLSFNLKKSVISSSVMLYRCFSYLGNFVYFITILSNYPNGAFFEIVVLSPTTC